VLINTFAHTLYQLQFSSNICQMLLNFFLQPKKEIMPTISIFCFWLLKLRIQNLQLYVEIKLYYVEEKYSLPYFILFY